MAACPLVQVAAVGRHVPDLRAGTGENGGGQKGGQPSHEGMGRGIGIGGKGTKVQAPLAHRRLCPEVW